MVSWWREREWHQAFHCAFSLTDVVPGVGLGAGMGQVHLVKSIELESGAK